MTAIDLSKQQLLDVDQKATQPINFTGDLAQEGNANLFIYLFIYLFYERYYTSKTITF